MKKRRNIEIQELANKFMNDHNTENKFAPKGFVQIVDSITGEPLSEKSNLIVYDSREIIAQVLFQQNRVESGVDQKDFGIYWLSIGDGGAAPSDPYTPLQVLDQDNSLQSEIQLVGEASEGYADGGFKKLIGDKAFLSDSLNDNIWAIVKTTTVISRNEANGKFINEAALWFSDSSNGTEAENFVLAARATFSSVYKTEANEPLIIWYWFL